MKGYLKINWNKRVLRAVTLKRHRLMVVGRAHSLARPFGVRGTRSFFQCRNDTPPRVRSTLWTARDFPRGSPAFYPRWKTGTISIPELMRPFFFFSTDERKKRIHFYRTTCISYFRGDYACNKRRRVLFYKSYLQCNVYV